MAAEALVPPGAARVAIRIATRVATVYTNAPKRLREAVLADLCTLLRRRPGGEAHVAGAVTQPPTHTSSRSLRYLRIYIVRDRGAADSNPVVPTMNVHARG